MKKQHVISIIIILMISMGLGYKYYSFKNPESPLVQVAKERVGTASSTTSVPATSSEASPVQIQTETPINGTLKGVIEVGASGFNSFVVNVDKDKNWELVSKEFGESLAYEGFITVQDVQTGLKKYLSKMFEKGVSGRNAHFVMSSGALKNEKTKMIAKAIEDMGYVVNRVTADQEGKYAIKALLPKAYKANSFTVDIGSGNTKITYYENGKPVSMEGPGAKYYQDGKADIDATLEIQKAVSKVPVNSRKYCFIIGGVPFKLASQSRNGEERFTSLKNPDEYSGGDDVKLKSGLNIYRAIYDNANSDSYIFDWDANFTIGFLLNLN